MLMREDSQSYRGRDGPRPFLAQDLLIRYLFVLVRTIVGAKAVCSRKEVGKAIMGDITVMKKDLYLLHRAVL